MNIALKKLEDRYTNYFKYPFKKFILKLFFKNLMKNNNHIYCLFKG